MMNAESIIREVVATAFDEDVTPSGQVTINLTATARIQAAHVLEQSNRAHREFGGYVSGTARGSIVTFEEFSHEISGLSEHVSVPWMDSDKTVAGWHSHPDQYEGTGRVPVTEDNGDPEPSADDFRAFNDADERGHLSVILGNNRMAVYDGERKIHSEALAV